MLFISRMSPCNRACASHANLTSLCAHLLLDLRRVLRLLAGSIVVLLHVIVLSQGLVVDHLLLGAIVNIVVRHGCC